jgi:hypothetical protein
MPEVDDDSVVELDVEVDSEVVPFTSDVEGAVDSVVESAGGVLLQATSAKQSTNARTPASNLFVNIAFSFLCAWVR